jgi:3'-5' exoribonuclease
LPEFPKETRTLLEHMLISHHGELEFGSPRVPLFPEALLLHHLDNLDSKMECMRAAIAHDRHASGCWTGYIAPLERVVLKKARFLEAPAPEEAGPASPPSVAPANPALTPPADRRAPQPVSGSLFGERLQEALRRE